MRIFLSFSFKDQRIAEAIRDGLLRLGPDLDIFFSPVSLSSGFWHPKLEQALAAADAFVLVVGPAGLAGWHQAEYFAAYNRHVMDSSFPLVPVIAGGAPAPGFQFLRTLNWIVAQDVSEDATLHRLLAALKGESVRQATPLWKLVNPYRGLESMTEAQADYFYGREAESAAVLNALADKPGHCPVLIGASGVGKSSIAQAGVIAALKASRWPGNTTARWPNQLSDSLNWVWLTIRPGEAPLEALAGSLTRLWNLDSATPRMRALPRRWAKGLASGENKLIDLIDETQERLQKKEGAAPTRFLLYLDQGEELYTRSKLEQSRIFSDILSQGLEDRRFSAFASIRADYYAHFQEDKALFDRRIHIDVPPLDRDRLHLVSNAPANALGVRFESEEVAERITEAAASDPGALPLLSYLLSEMWQNMAERGDPTLRLPAKAIDIGGVLARNADAFLATQPEQEHVLRRLLTLRLASVLSQGAPIRRPTPRTECTAEEWAIASRLADHPWRLVVIRERESDQAIMAEVAHEAFLRAWPRLTKWLRDERDFLVFKSDAEEGERRWQAMGQASAALLTGFDLARASDLLPKRGEDLSSSVVHFLKKSIEYEKSIKERQLRFQRRVIAGAFTAATCLALLCLIIGLQWRQVASQRNAALVTQSRHLSDISRDLLASGDAVSAMLVALAGLPNSDPSTERSGSDRPYVPELEGQLYSAYLQQRELRVYDNGGIAVRHVRFSSDGRRALTGSDDAARIWNLETGKIAAEARISGAGAARAIAWFPNGKRFVSGWADSRIRIFDENNLVEELPGTATGVTDIVVSPDGDYFASVSENGSISIRRAPDWRVAHSLTVAGASRLALTRDASHVIVGSTRGTVTVIDLATGLPTVSEPGSPIIALAILQDGKTFVSASTDGSISRWNTTTATVDKNLHARSHGLTSIAIDPVKGDVFAGFNDGSIDILDNTDGHVRSTVRGHVKDVMSIDVDPTGASFISASLDGTARLWRRRGRETTTRLSPLETVASAAPLPPLPELVSATPAGIVAFGPASAPRLLAPGPERASKLAASRDGSVVVVPDQTAALILDPATGRTKVIDQGSPVTAVAASADGRLVATGASDASVRIWNTASLSPVTVLWPDRALHPNPAPVVSIDFSPDGLMLAATAATSVRIFDLAVARERPPLRPHLRSTTAAVFSPDGKMVATGSLDGAVYLWPVASDATVAKLTDKLPGAITGLAIDETGAKLVAASKSGHIGVWNYATRDFAGLIRIGDQPLSSVAFVPGRGMLSVGNTDGEVVVLPFFSSEQDLIREARRSLPRCLTTEQRHRYHIEDSGTCGASSWQDR